MSDREEFEKWADSHGLSGKQRFAAFLAFKLRQPEIDALKAEVERLRSEREKVVRQAKQNDKLLFENAALAGKLMQYEEPERYAEYCRILDEKNAAMKEGK